MTNSTHCFESSVSLTDALDRWNSWNLDQPPVDATGNTEADRMLADDFRCLLSASEANHFKIVEWKLTRANSDAVCRRARFPYSLTLMKWWFDLWNRNRNTPVQFRPAKMVQASPQKLPDQRAELCLLSPVYGAPPIP